MSGLSHDHDGQRPPVVGGEEDDADVHQGEEEKNTAADGLRSVDEEEADDYPHHTLGAVWVDCKVLLVYGAQRRHREVDHRAKPWRNGIREFVALKDSKYLSETSF